MMITKYKVPVMANWIKRIGLLLAVVWLAGCTNAQKRQQILSQGQPMKDIYENNTSSSYDELDNNQIGYATGDLAGYTRDSSNEINQLFPTIRNPMILVFVYPHLTADGLPVPGYTTQINMYDQSINYALPGESQE